MSFWAATYEIARKEFMQHLRTKRLLIVGVIMAGFLLLATLVIGPGIVEDIDFASTSKQHIVLSFYFAVGFIGGFQFTQLLAIVLTADAITSEWARRTIFLILSKPVSRFAFVTGKFLGNLATLAVALTSLFMLTYMFMLAAYPGVPTGIEFLGFLGTLGFIVLGTAAFASIAMFVSSITRSTGISLTVTLAAWVLVFPLVGNIGTFTHLDEPDIDFDDPAVDWSRYLNPAAAMQAGARLLVPDENDQDILQLIEFANPLAWAPVHTGLAALSLVAFTAVFYAGTLLVVWRRDFD